MNDTSKQIGAIDPASVVKPYWKNYVGGEWVDSTKGERLDVFNPATGAKIAEVACADEQDVDRAVAAARRCADSRVLTAMRPAERGRMLIEAARLFRQRREEIATILTFDCGKSISEARGEIDGTARYLEYYGGAADKIEGRYIPLGEGLVEYVVPVPYGVSAHIVPWNYPCGVMARSVAPALAAGNALVVKTPELDPLSGMFFAEILEQAGFPPGALNLICGHGKIAGAALAAHPGVNQITFTGSIASGQSVLRGASNNVVPCVMELGGKSAAIVFADADLDSLVRSVRTGSFDNAGQVCNALSRLIVHRDIYDEVVNRLVAMVNGLSIGPGIEDHDISPLISRQQLTRVAALTRSALEQGAHAATGGQPVENVPGFFMPPTLLRDVTPDMRVAQEEIFGPVLSIIAFDTAQEALEIANGTEYGLAAGVFSASIDRALWAAEMLHAGQIYVNEWEACGCETPFGGMKKSGFGREKGLEALGSYYQSKLVAVRRLAF